MNKKTGHCKRCGDYGYGCLEFDERVCKSCCVELAHFLANEDDIKEFCGE